MEIDVRGDIISNDDKWIYDWLDWDSTCPNDIKNAIASLQPGETLTVNINSGGGSVMADRKSILFLPEEVTWKSTFNRLLAVRLV